MPFCQQKFIFNELCTEQNEYLLELPEFQQLINQWFFALLEGQSPENQLAKILDMLDLILQGTYGAYNHGYLLLAFEKEFAERKELCKFHMREFFEDFCAQVDEENLAHREN